MVLLSDISNDKGLLFTCINARSIYPKRVNIKRFISHTDITGVVETWLNPTINDAMLYLPGYQFFRLDRYPIIDKGAGGLMLYLRDTYIASIDDDATFMTSQYEILAIDVDIGEIKYKLFVCYRPPGKDVSRSAIYDKLTELKSKITKNRKLIFFGDFNNDLLDSKIVESCKVNDFCINNDLFQLISEVTRPKSSSLLDHIYINGRIHNVAASGTIDYHIADHTPLYILIKCIRNKIKKKTVKARSYKNYDYILYRNMLYDHDWNDVICIDDPDVMWTAILDILYVSLDKMCPIKTMVLPEYTPDWLTPVIINEMNHRDNLYRHARQTGLVDDLRIANFYRNRVESKITTNKNSFNSIKN